MRRRTLQKRKRLRQRTFRLRPDSADHHHSVYAVLLDRKVLTSRSAAQLNRDRNAPKLCVYVGMTGLPVDDRFQNHLNGYKSARVVKKYGIRLLPELYEHLNPMPFEAAAQMEKDLTEDLRAEGYAVFGGT